MSKKGGGSQTQTTEPPKYLRPYLRGAMTDAQNLYNQGGPEYYPGETVVPFSSQSQQAMDLTQQRALAGSPLTRSAQGYATSQLQSPISSQFGSASYDAGPNMFGGASNPMLDRMFDQAAMRTRPALDSQFAGSGRNLEAQMPARADQLNDLATNIYGGAYENERNRQLQYQQQLTGIGAQGYENERNRMADDLQAQRQNRLGLLGFAPTLANQDYFDYQQLGGVGQQVEDLTGRLMEDQAARWDFDQNREGANLDQYLARLNQYPGSTTSTPVYRNQAAGALGGGMMGYQMFGNPWGALGGALMGGLLS